MLQRRDRRFTLNAAVAQAVATAEAVVRMDMQPHGIWSIARCPALRAKLQSAGLLNRDTFSGCIQMRFREIQGVGQPLPRLGFEHRGVTTLYFANALGMNAGFCGHCPLTHAEG